MTSRTSDVILYFMENLRLHNVSIHRNFYQNLFIKEYARKKKVKIPVLKTGFLNSINDSDQYFPPKSGP